MINLARVVTDDELAAIKAEVGTEWAADIITVADIVEGMAGIGYGGHYDETSDEEDAVHSIVTADADEFAELQRHRYRYANAVRDAVNAVSWKERLT